MCNSVIIWRDLNSYNYSLLIYLNKKATLRVAFLFSMWGEIHINFALSSTLMFILAHHRWLSVKFKLFPFVLLLLAMTKLAKSLKTMPFITQSVI